MLRTGGTYMVKRIAAAALVVAALSAAVPAQSGYYHTPGTPSEPGTRHDNSDSPLGRSLFTHTGSEQRSEPFRITFLFSWGRYSVGELEQDTAKLVRAVSTTSPDRESLRKHAVKIRRMSEDA